MGGPEDAMPSVSVIVPNYNHARFLPKRIESILRQTYQDFELILLDDCSTDDSRAILSQYASDPRIRMEFSDVNSGSTFKQWNKGVRLASGKYVWIAESDDYADERLLETLVSRLEAEPAAVLANCRSWRVSAEGHSDGLLDVYLGYLDPLRWTVDFSADGREECRKYLIFGNSVQSASSVVFRREVYWQVGGADENFVFCGDWKTWAAMALTGGTFVHVGQPLNYCRFHEATVTARVKRLGVGTVESLRVARWIQQKVTLEKSVYRRLCRGLPYWWVPAVLNLRTPLRLRAEILHEARMIDPYTPLRVMRPAASILRWTATSRYRSLRAKFLRNGTRLTSEAGGTPKSAPMNRNQL
jgi:glycosyltransferase involved in cell wall biosynthesis